MDVKMNKKYLEFAGLHRNPDKAGEDEKCWHSANKGQEARKVYRTGQSLSSKPPRMATPTNQSVDESSNVCDHIFLTIWPEMDK